MEALHRALSSNATTDGGDEENGVNAALIVSLTLGGGALVCTLVFVVMYKMCTQKKQLETILYFDGIRYWCLWTPTS